MFSCAFVLLALFAATQGRAVNISNTWVLPEEGFPVFYRYFRDRISWYEADAVCQFHHANLVTVDTTAQYDAVRAYLKELDISSAVWVGLIRSNPEGDFTWTDYHGLTGDGYWSSAPDARAAPLCAAADPAADYRWEARACGGPTVASFICELPVPQWALGSQGCMVRSLPALTVLYLPESAAVQLTADCGLAGTKRVHCTGKIKREVLLKNISCTEDENSSTPNILSIGTSWSTTDTSFTDQDATNDATTEDALSTENKDMNAAEEHTTQVPKKYSIVLNKSPVKPKSMLAQLTQHYLNKDMNLNILQENNVERNDIPQHAKGGLLLTEEQSERLEDEKHIHYKMLHDELAKHGNFENIFTQPTDHFVPPLVMAKAKISDDMTVLSLAEKHAQQLAEERLARYNKHDDIIKRPLEHIKVKSSTPQPTNIVLEKAPTILSIQPSQVLEHEKKDKVKTILKKYNKKHEDPKRDSILDSKFLKKDQMTESSTILYNTEDITTKAPTVDMTSEGDNSLDLTVMLKELGMENNTAPLFTNRSRNIPVAELSHKDVTSKKPVISEKNTTEIISITSTPEIQTNTGGITFNHEVVRITTLNNDEKNSRNLSEFEITTKVPLFKDDATNKNILSTSSDIFVTVNPVTIIESETDNTTIVINKTPSTTESQTFVYTMATDAKATANDKTSTALRQVVSNNNIPTVTAASTTDISFTAKKDASSITSTLLFTTSTEESFTSDTGHINLNANKIITVSGENYKTQTIKSNTSESSHESTSQMMVSEKVLHDNGEIMTETRYVNAKDAGLNFTLSHEDFNEKGTNDTSEDGIDDFQSPLLSAANEPLHRPNRSRRPQKPHLNNFNPFRILG